ncbi:MAG TPA: DUF58 domain-containing protein [Anaerolineaceae bacterium]|nr:DUF58 domain-containing protein [Anaerolineaceae bacterium]
MVDFIPLLVILLIVAALLREDSVLLIFYLVGGIFLVGSWWSRYTLRQIQFRRSLPNRAFLGDTIPIHLELYNPGRLPTLWVLIHDSLPLDLIAPNFFQQVTLLGPRDREVFDYHVNARKRGYYQVGPLYLESGDLFGLVKENHRQGPTDELIVYPLIIPLSRIGLPTNSPFGTLRFHQPIFEDPTRVIGKREYLRGDSLRHVDWKSTAASGQMLVKKFEPSIALEACIFLDLNQQAYDFRHHFDQTELAIVAAASIANWVIQKKQSIGLSTNGLDPLRAGSIPGLIPPHKGQGHLMDCLDLLARIQAAVTRPILEKIRSESPLLAWGATVLVITGQLGSDLFDELLQAQRRGLSVSVLLAGSAPGLDESRKKASHYGIQVHQVAFQGDLEMWR